MKLPRYNLPRYNFPRPHLPSRRYTLELAIIVLVYVVAAKIGLSLAVTTHQVTTIWPPTGIALAVVFLGGYRYLPGIAIGAFIVNALTQEPWLVAAGVAVGNTLEAFLGAYLLKRIVHFRSNFHTIRDVLGFYVCAGVVAPLPSATIGTLSLTLGGIVPWARFGHVWATWWIGNLLGALIFGGALFVWSQASSRRSLLRQPIEAGIILALVLAASVVVFTAPAIPSVPLTPAAYVMFPLLIWCAFRLQQAGVVTAAVLMTLTALYASLHGYGPFTGTGAALETDLIYLQLYVLVTSATGMILAVTVARRMRAESELRAMSNQLKDANQRVTDILEGVLERDLR